MNNIITALQNYCEENCIILILGDQNYVNAVSDGRKYENGQLVMIADFQSVPTFANGQVMTTSYPGVIALGRKIESNISRSSLDETFEQKYNNRLAELGELLIHHLGNIACDNDFDLTNVNIRYLLNQYDINIDFISATLSFVD